MSRVPVPFGVQKRQRHPSRFFAGCCAAEGEDTAREGAQRGAHSSESSVRRTGILITPGRASPQNLPGKMDQTGSPKPCWPLALSEIGLWFPDKLVSQRRLTATPAGRPSEVPQTPSSQAQQSKVSPGRGLSVSGG